VVRCLLDDATKTLVHAFIASRLDYCNALFLGITKELACSASEMTCIVSVQNAAAGLATGAKRSDHISPVLRHLHWLPVRQRVVFNIATLVYRSLSGHSREHICISSTGGTITCKLRPRSLVHLGRDCLLAWHVSGIIVASAAAAHTGTKLLFCVLRLRACNSASMI